MRLRGAPLVIVAIQSSCSRHGKERFLATVAPPSGICAYGRSKVVAGASVIWFARQLACHWFPGRGNFEKLRKQCSAQGSAVRFIGFKTRRAEGSRPYIVLQMKKLAPIIGHVLQMRRRQTMMWTRMPGGRRMLVMESVGTVMWIR